MIRPSKKIVLYFPQQSNPRLGQQPPLDMLPLAMLAIAGIPVREGYDVRIIDGNLFSQAEAHRIVVEECKGAVLYATTGILGYQVKDAVLCTRSVAAALPDLPRFIGGWFASVEPELQLSTGLYDAVVLGQGEITFAEIVEAVTTGSSLEDVAGLMIERDGEYVRTAHRTVAGFTDLAPTPWQLIEIDPYRTAQKAEVVRRERGALPPGFANEAPFSINYFGSFGCPEPCSFCCSPEFSGRRWKSVAGVRMAEELIELHERWKFDAVQFMDANWGVMEKRTRDYSETMLEHDVPFAWYAFMQANSINRYSESTMDLLQPSGLYEAKIGGETGDSDMMGVIGKHSHETENVDAAVRIDERGIAQAIYYIVGYPHEKTESMLATVDEARRIAATCQHSRPTIYPYQPIPGSPMYTQSLELGYVPPQSVEDWGEFQEYHLGELDHWPNQVPTTVVKARQMYEHYYSLSRGLSRGFKGWWERRAQRRMAGGFLGASRLEAKAFDAYDRAFKRRKTEIKRGTLTTLLPAVAKR